MKKPNQYALLTLLTTAAVSAAAPAYADVTVSGDVSPQNPTDPWDIGQSVLVVGGPSGPGEGTSGKVIIENRGTLISGGAVLGPKDLSTGTVQVVGVGSTWINHGLLTLSGRSDSSGFLSVETGAKVTTDDLLLGERGVGGQAELVIKGYGATLTSYGTATIGRSEADIDLTIQQGGSFFSKDASVVSGVVTLTGYASKWVNTGEFIVAGDRSATINVATRPSSPP